MTQKYWISIRCAISWFLIVFLSAVWTPLHMWELFHCKSKSSWFPRSDENKTWKRETIVAHWEKLSRISWTADCNFVHATSDDSARWRLSISLLHYIPHRNLKNTIKHRKNRGFYAIRSHSLKQRSHRVRETPSIISRSLEVAPDYVWSID